jgi:hypothetical protein
MKPIQHLKLHSLSEHLNLDLLKQAHTIEDVAIKGTISSLERKALLENDTDSLNKISELKSLYNFNSLPLHIKKIVDLELENRIREEIGIGLPAGIDFEVQAVTADHFPSNSFIHNDGNGPGVRKVSWYYLLTESAAKTSFYNSDTGPFFGPVWRPIDVTEVDSKIMLQHNWYSFNHNHIHGVTGVTGPRYALIINFSKAFESYETCMENFRELISE